MGSSLIISPSASASPVLVRDAGGLPVPPSEIVQRIKQIHPALNIRFAEGLAGSGWSITWEWEESDRRREWVRDGRTDPAMAYDIIGYLPFGCSVDGAPAYIENCLKQYPREEVQRLTERVQHYNYTGIGKAQVSDAVVGTMDSIQQATKEPVGLVASVPSGKVKSRRVKA